jgi:hypothetical protein
VALSISQAVDVVLSGEFDGVVRVASFAFSACMRYPNISRRIFRFAQQPGSASPADTCRGIDDVQRRSVSYRSYRSFWSVLSASSVLSVASAASLLSIGSFASILSIGSSNSVLSIGSDGGFLSIGGSRRSRPGA